MLFESKPLPPKYAEAVAFIPDHVTRAMLTQIGEAVIATADLPGDVVFAGCRDANKTAFVAMAMQKTLSSKKLYVCDPFPVEYPFPEDCNITNDMLVDADAGKARIAAALAANNVQYPVDYIVGHYNETGSSFPSNIALAVCDVPHKPWIYPLFYAVYANIVDGGIALWDGYGLGFTKCVKAGLDDLLNLRPEKMENTVSGIQGGFKRAFQPWEKTSPVVKTPVFDDE